MDAVEQYEARHPNTYFWFDLFVNNQHQATDHPFEWWCTTFQASIGAIGHVMLVMSPWDQPTPITRSWCLWEIFSAMQAAARIEVVIPTSQRAQLKEKIIAYDKVVLAAIMGIDAERAEAFKPQDRDSIAQVVTRCIGFAALNNRVRDHLRDRYRTYDYYCPVLNN